MKTLWILVFLGLAGGMFLWMRHDRESRHSTDNATTGGIFNASGTEGGPGTPGSFNTSKESHNSVSLRSSPKGFKDSAAPGAAVTGKSNGFETKLPQSLEDRTIIRDAKISAEKLVRIDREFSVFFDTLKISGDVRKKAGMAIANKEETASEVLRLSREQGLSRADTRKLMDEEFQASFDELAGVIGEENARALITFGMSQSYVPTARDFADRCAANGIPVSTDLINPLAGILAVTHVMKPGANHPMTEPDFLKLRESRNGHGLEAAGKWLTPQQLNIFKQIMAERDKHDVSLPDK